MGAHDDEVRQQFFGQAHDVLEGDARHSCGLDGHAGLIGRVSRLPYNALGFLRMALPEHSDPSVGNRMVARSLLPSSWV
jgi:hypothetical protein